MTSADRPTPGSRATPRARWRGTLPLVFVFVSLLALLVTPIALTSEIMDVRDEISERIEPARAALTDVDLALAREVSSIRGYLLTRDETLLEGYRRARRTELERQADLERAVAELGPALEARAARLRQLSAAWNSGNAEMPAFAAPAARERWLRGRQRLYDAVLDEAVTLNAGLAAEAEARRDRIRDLERISSLVTAFLSLLALASTGFLVVTGRRLAGEADRLERRVRERTEALSEANQELEAFAHSVSHDLRAPVRAVSGFSQALLEDAGERLEKDELEYLGRIQNAARRMDLLIDDLLAYSRISRLDARLETVSLGPLVNEVLAAVREAYPGSADAMFVRQPLPRVRAHRSVLAQAVQNLLGNALKFVPAGRPPRVVVRAEERGTVARLWVEDNGIGIAPEHQERIFRVFERLHGVETYPGTGIGLAIVRRGMERMGGAAGVESAPGEGSRFWIELPLATPDER